MIESQTSLEKRIVAVFLFFSLVGKERIGHESPPRSLTKTVPKYTDHKERAPPGLSPMRRYTNSKRVGVPQPSKAEGKPCECFEDYAHPYNKVIPCDGCSVMHVSSVEKTSIHHVH